MSSTHRRSGGFTLLEVLLSIAILGMVTAVTVLAFSTATQVWRRSTIMTDNLHHGDFVIDQLVMALRSTCYPSEAGTVIGYGFTHEDHGDGSSARDRIGWVKLGRSLVDPQANFVESPHRVEFFVHEDPDGETAAASIAWPLMGMEDDFDPDTLDPMLLSSRVVGFDCKAAHEAEVDEDIEWQDEWDQTNRIPRVVAITLYLKPVAEGEEPLAMHRIVEIPVGDLAWGK